MVVGDAIAGFIWATGRRRTGHFIHTIRFLSQSFLVRWHDGPRERSWEGVEACLGYLFLAVTPCVWYFLLCVHDDEGTGRAF